MTAFIDEHREVYGVEPICRVLRIAPSAYYARLACRADPAKASGLDAAVKTLGQAPFGQFLLILAALGIAAFGAYSFVRSRYGRL